MVRQGPDDNDKVSDLDDAKSHDFYSVLRKIVNEATQDPSLLRNLVYSLARYHLWSETVLSQSPSSSQAQSSILANLHETLALESAIKRLEADFVASANPPVAGTPSLPSEIAQLLEQWKQEEGRHQALSNQKAMLDDNKAILEGSPSGNAVVPIAEGPTSQEFPLAPALSVTSPPSLDARGLTLPDTIDYVPARRTGRIDFRLIGPAIICAAMFAVVFGWDYLARLRMSGPAAQTVQSQASATTSGSTDRIINGRSAAVVSPGESSLPFPLPTAYGVFAISEGRLVELQPLAIRMPDPRILVSAPINTPARATVKNGKVEFIIFRRDLLNNAPQTISVRVVARVRRTMKFVDGKAMIGSSEGSWRIRANAYQFRVSPVDDNREMIVVTSNPGFVLPAGRYALVVNGLGYDFAVDGPITSLDQCLEQVEAVNGTMLSECPKS